MDDEPRDPGKGPAAGAPEIGGAGEAAERVSRRRWLSGGAATAALAGAGLVVSQSRTAQAVTGDYLRLGFIGTADRDTWLEVSKGPRGLFVLFTSNGVPDTSNLVGAVVGYSYTSVPGVRGVSVSWNGVIGESTNVVGVVGRSNKDAGVLGTSVASYGIVGQSTNLTGVWGTGPAYGVRGDSAKTGVWGSSTGPAGAYAGVQGTSANNVGVQGTSTAATGVVGQSTNGRGVVGTSTYGIAVYAKSANTYGMWGESAGSVGVLGRDTAGGTGGYFWSTSGWGAYCKGAVGAALEGASAAVRLVPQTRAGKPTTGAHAMGEMLCDSAGVLWFCTKSGTPGTWKKVTLT